MSSFLELPPEYCDPANARYIIQPIPYEGTACFMKGTAAGPQAILEVSNQMEHFDEETLREYFKSGIATLPTIPPADTPEKEMRRIYETITERRVFANGRFPIFIGGEHSISEPLIKACAENHGSIGVLQFDAHSDLRDSFTGGKFSHASVMRRVLEITPTPSLVQVGIRSISAEEHEECPGRIARIITPQMLLDDFSASLEKIISGLCEKVYITFDIDAFDPAYAPGTGTPEPGGLDWFTARKILRRVFETKTVLAADIVETSPLGGGNVVTEFLAARLLGKFIAYHENRNRLDV